MRLSILALGLCACGGASPPTKPDPAALKKLSYEAQCEAVAPRVAPCANEIMIADLRELDPDPSSSGTRALSEDIERRGTPSADEGRKIAILSCMGTRDEKFPSQVLACWEIEDCARFVACTTSR